MKAQLALIFFLKFIRNITVVILTFFLISFPTILSAEESKSRTIRVGFILPMTGPAADFGVAMKNAIQLALEDFRGAPIKIEPIIDDAQYEVKNAVNSLAALWNVSKVDIVVVWGLGQCRAVAPVAEKQKIPLIAICLAPEVAVSRPHVLRFQSSSDDYMRATTDWLKAAGVKRIGVLLSENGYTEEMFAALERQIHSDQRISIIDRVPAVGQDFYSQVMKIRSAKFDAFGLFLAVAQAGTFAKQVSLSEKQPIVFGTNVVRSESEIVNAGGKLEGALVSDIRIQQSFLDRYVTNFKSEAQLGFAALAYETIRLISNQTAVVLDNESLGQVVFNRIVSSGVHRSTVVGDYSIKSSPREGNYAQFDLGMMRVKGLGFEYVPDSK